MAEPVATALFSIHDVMPDTLHDVGELIERFARAGLPLPGLLVVPARGWQAPEIRQLRDWQTAGAELIAHGWHHHTTPRRPFHRLHAAVLSRNVAEHLALDRDGIVALMRRSRSWFGEQGLALPQTYVPPAWALGMPSHGLAALPYRCVETLREVHLIDAGHVRRRQLPLVGFEADTTVRRWVLRGWNALQRRRALRLALPLRVSIHPADARLRLADELQHFISCRWQAVQYRDLAR